MPVLFQSLLIVNAVFFLFYGFQCLVSQYMIGEFKRYGLPDSQRLLTGILQILGSAGLLTGFIFPVIGALASAGLSLMMLVAFVVRIKIRDGFFQSAPSLIFMVLNAYLSITFIRFYNSLQ